MIKINLFPKQLIVFFIFAILIVTAINFQTTVWFSFFGYFPSPCAWAPLFVYLMMNRSFPKNFLWLMFFYLMFLTQTVAVPLTLFFSLLSLWGIIYFFQKRVSTLGLFDFIVFSAGSVVLFPVIYYIYSLAGSGAPDIDLLNIVISLFLSIPIIPMTLAVCKKIDAIFDRFHNNSDNLVLDI
jgi:hypothetical protein